MIIEDDRYMLEKKVVRDAAKKTVESLKHMEHGGLDVIKDAVTDTLNSIDTYDFSYFELDNKIFMHVLTMLEDEYQLAHILMM